MADAPVTLYCTGARGLSVLQHLGRVAPQHLDAMRVVVASDPAMADDGYRDIARFCEQYNVPWCDRLAASPALGWAVAVGWRWMLRPCQRLVVLHDSLLPRYRGFAPVVTALLENEPYVGVSSLLGSEEYDRGDILAQRRIAVNYPVKIADVLERLLPLYAELAAEVLAAIISGRPMAAQPQDEALASYSLWRDDEDYLLDWGRSSTALRDHINAVGPPYRGASTRLEGRLLRVLHATCVPDVSVHQRTNGKVLFVREGRPVVTCGSGLLQIEDMRDDASARSVLPLRRFRSRFV